MTALSVDFEVDASTPWPTWLIVQDYVLGSSLAPNEPLDTTDPAQSIHSRRLIEPPPGYMATIAGSEANSPASSTAIRSGSRNECYSTRSERMIVSIRD